MKWFSMFLNNGYLMILVSLLEEPRTLKLGLLNSLNKSPPCISEIVGCYFHFKQAISRKLKELGVGKNTEYLTYLAGTLNSVTKSEIHLVFDYMEEKAVQKMSS
jgi:hypothetical protein